MGDARCRYGAPLLPDDEVQRIVRALHGLLTVQFAGKRSALAEALEISVVALRKLLDGKSRPSYATARRLAALLHVPIERLFSGAPINMAARETPRLATLSSVLARNEGVFSKRAIEFALLHEKGARELKEIDWYDTLCSLTRVFERLE